MEYNHALRRALLPFFLLGSMIGLYADPAAPAPVDFSATLAPILARHKLPGLAALALRGDQVVAQGGTGVRKAGGPEPITLADQFHLGSDTKAMTATLIAMLIEEGKLQWTTTLGELFGQSVKALRPEWKDVTVRQVLTHRAGLPANVGAVLKARLLLGEKPLTEQRQIIVAEILSGPPVYPPGTKYQYSNVDYILLGAVFEQLTGRRWEDGMRQRLFEPLHIATGGFGAPGSASLVDQPWGHHASGAAVSPGSRAADNPPFLGPAGTAHMTIGDWAKFIALHLRGDPGNPQSRATLLKPESFAALHTPAPGEDYAGGWIATTRPWAKGGRPGDTGRTLTHSGSNTMWYCTAWLAPEIDFAVLITCNEGGDEAAKACDEVAGALIRQFGPKPLSK